MDNAEKKSKILVDADACIGCGTCEGIAPDYFKIEDGVSVPLKEFGSEDLDLINDAIDSCPVQAISIAKENEE